MQGRGVPCTHNDPSVCGLVLNLVDYICKLVEALASVVSITVDVLCAEVAPLEAIHRPKIALMEANRYVEWHSLCLPSTMTPNVCLSTTVRSKEH